MPHTERPRSKLLSIRLDELHEAVLRASIARGEQEASMPSVEEEPEITPSAPSRSARSRADTTASTFSTASSKFNTARNKAADLTSSAKSAASTATANARDLASKTTAKAGAALKRGASATANLVRTSSAASMLSSLPRKASGFFGKKTASSQDVIDPKNFVKLTSEQQVEHDKITVLLKTLLDNICQNIREFNVKSHASAPELKTFAGVLKRNKSSEESAIDTVRLNDIAAEIAYPNFSFQGFSETAKSTFLAFGDFIVGECDHAKKYDAAFIQSIISQDSSPIDNIVLDILTTEEYINRLQIKIPGPPPGSPARSSIKEHNKFSHVEKKEEDDDELQGDDLVLEDNIDVLPDASLIRRDIPPLKSPSSNLPQRPALKKPESKLPPRPTQTGLPPKSSAIALPPRPTSTAKGLPPRPPNGKGKP